MTKKEELMNSIIGQPIHPEIVICLYENPKSTVEQIATGVDELLEKICPTPPHGEKYNTKPGYAKWVIGRLCEKGIVAKEKECYQLTEDGKNIYPYVKRVIEQTRSGIAEARVRVTPYANVSLAPLFE
jgi:hypothetical protein